AWYSEPAISGRKVLKSCGRVSDSGTNVLLKLRTSFAASRGGREAGNARASTILFNRSNPLGTSPFWEARSETENVPDGGPLRLSSAAMKPEMSFVIQAPSLVGSVVGPTNENPPVRRETRKLWVALLLTRLAP